VLQKAGIDITVFRAHSVRGAATSEGVTAGLSLSDISKAAGCLELQLFENITINLY